MELLRQLGFPDRNPFLPECELSSKGLGLGHRLGHIGDVVKCRLLWEAASQDGVPLLTIHYDGIFLVLSWFKIIFCVDHEGRLLC